MIKSIINYLFSGKKESYPSVLSFGIHNTNTDKKGTYHPPSSEDKKKQKFYQSIKI